MKEKNDEYTNVDSVSTNNNDIDIDDVISFDENESEDIEIDIDLDYDNIDNVNIEKIADDIETISDDVSYQRNAKLVGKHSLRHDKIFVGGKPRRNVSDEDDLPIEEEKEEYDDNTIDKMSFEIEYDSSVLGVYLDTDERLRIKQLKERVYNAIINHTNINVSAPRRKPSKNDFNKYFKNVKKQLENDMFSDAEIFVELSIYFSDNLFGMFKLLDSSISSKILADLKVKYNFSEINDLPI